MALEIDPVAAITGGLGALGGFLATIFAFRNDKKKVDTDAKTAASDDALKLVKAALDISQDLQGKLKNEMAAMQGDIERLETQCDTVIAKNKQLIDENEKLRETVDMQSRQLKQLTDENERLKADIATFMDKVTAVEMKVEARDGQK